MPDAVKAVLALAFIACIAAGFLWFAYVRREASGRVGRSLVNAATATGLALLLLGVGGLLSIN